MRVAVTYASDPERVLKILRGVATAHPKVLAAPAPLALCTGFGDSGMTFELRAWAFYEESLEVRSELAVAVHAALTAAKIEIAVPERHIHIRNAEGEALAIARRTPGP
jgi:small-conductance mechanosensitive channel